MYGSSRYGSEHFCPFDYDSGYYGEPEAHVVNGGVASLAVPGGEAPSTSSGQILVGSQSETPLVTQASLWSGNVRDEISVLDLAAAEVAVPGVEAPSTIDGVSLSAFGLVAILAPMPPRYMFSETFISGTANPYLYDTNLYDEKVLEDPYTSFTVSQYNTGMALTECMFGTGQQSIQGGFEFAADSLMGVQATHNLHSAVVVADENEFIGLPITLPWDGASPPYVWDALIAESLHNAQSRPQIPQLIREATVAAGLLTPELDTKQLIPMSFGGIVMDVFTSPDGFIIAPSHMATAFNGLFYIQEKITDRFIYGSKYHYLYRNAQYLGITNWRVQYIDGNKVAGVLTGVMEADLACGKSAVDDIPADYLFALHNPVATMSYNVAAMDPSAGEMLPRMQYTSDVYLGRSARYNGIMHASIETPGATIVLRTPDFLSDHDAIEFAADDMIVLDNMEGVLCARYDDSVAPIEIALAEYLCGRSDPGAEYGDVLNVQSAYGAYAAPALDDSTDTLLLQEAVHDLDEPFILPTHIAAALFAVDNHPLFIAYDTCETIAIGLAESVADPTSSLDAAMLDAREATNAVLVTLPEDTAHGSYVSFADRSCAPSLFLTGYITAAAYVVAYVGSTREENALALAGIFESVFDCGDASPEFVAATLFSVTVDEGRGGGGPGQRDEAADVRIFMSDKRDCAFSYSYIDAEGGIEIVVVAANNGEAPAHEVIVTAGPAFLEFTCSHSSVSGVGEIADGFEFTEEGIVHAFSDQAAVVDIALSDPGVEDHGMTFDAAFLELGDFVLMPFDTITATTMAYATASCAYSAAEFYGDITIEGVYINIAPQPYWYDFVIEYDYQSTTDPSDMAFIF